MDTGAYMENQMDNLIEASEHLYDEKCNELDAKIEAYIKEKGYTWTVEGIIDKFRESEQGYYISHTAKDVVSKFSKDLKLLVKPLRP